jgi:chemotaxis signal transduction protein
VNAPASRLVDVAASLRRAFDQTFAEAPTSDVAPHENVLAIRLGGDPYVLRLNEIAGLHADRKIVAVPSRVKQFLGIVGLRGALVPAFDLGALLGYAPVSEPRWFALARGSATIGLAFETFDAQLQVAKESFSPATKSAAREHVGGAVRIEGSVRSVIDIGSVLDAVERRTSSAPRRDER